MKRHSSNDPDAGKSKDAKPSGHMLASAGRFKDSEGGATAIEFAIVSLPFIALVLFIFQIALYHFGLQSLDLANSVASREIMTGAVPTSSHTLASFKTNNVCPRLLLNFDCSKVIVNAYKVNGPSNAATNTGIYKFVDATAKALRATPVQSTFCIGGPGDYVFLDIAYSFPNLMGNVMVAAGAEPERFMMRSTSFFRNELYVGDGQKC